jgi:hypothetical protein
MASDAALRAIEESEAQMGESIMVKPSLLGSAVKKPQIVGGAEKKNKAEKAEKSEKQGGKKFANDKRPKARNNKIEN